MHQFQLQPMYNTLINALHCSSRKQQVLGKQEKLQEQTLQCRQEKEAEEVELVLCQRSDKEQLEHSQCQIGPLSATSPGLTS